MGFFNPRFIIFIEYHIHTSFPLIRVNNHCLFVCFVFQTMFCSFLTIELEWLNCFSLLNSAFFSFIISITFSQILFLFSISFPCLFFLSSSLFFLSLSPFLVWTVMTQMPSATPFLCCVLQTRTLENSVLVVLLLQMELLSLLRMEGVFLNITKLIQPKPL